MCDPGLQKIIEASIDRSSVSVFQTFDASQPSMR